MSRSLLEKASWVAGIVSALVAVWLLVLPLLASRPPAKQLEEQPPPLRLPLTVFNGLTSTPIWIPPEAELQILQSVTPATDAVVASLRVRLDMPNVNTMNGNFQIEYSKSEKGFIDLPAKFDYRAHIDRGLTYRVLVRPTPYLRMLRAEGSFDSSASKKPLELAYLLQE